MRRGASAARGGDTHEPSGHPRHGCRVWRRGAPRGDGARPRLRDFRWVVYILTLISMFPCVTILDLNISKNM